MKNALARIGLCIKALRLYSFPAPVAPVLICAAIVHRSGAPFQAAELALLLAGVCALFFGANLVNDYYDFKKGVDTHESLGASGVLVHGLLSPGAVRTGYRVLYAIACSTGLYFIFQQGLPLLMLLLAGIAGGYLYTGGPYPFKYHGLGELAVFLLMGPLLFAAMEIALRGALSRESMLLSPAFGALSAAVLQANNLRDIGQDRSARITTTATLLGYPGARIFFTFLLLAPFAVVALLAGYGIYSKEILICWAALPAAFWVCLPVWKKNPQGRLRNLVQAAFAFQLLFSFLLIPGILLSRS